VKCCPIWCIWPEKSVFLILRMDPSEKLIEWSTRRAGSNKKRCRCEEIR
jgi:hypothetical protein